MSEQCFQTILISTFFCDQNNWANPKNERKKNQSISLHFLRVRERRLLPRIYRTNYIGILERNYDSLDY